MKVGSMVGSAIIRRGVSGVVCSLLWCGVSFAQQQQGSTENREVKHDESAPLTEIPPILPKFGPMNEMRKHPQIPHTEGPQQGDPAVQSSLPTLAAATGGANFEGIGNGVYGYAVTSAPPDPNGAVGPNHYVQWVNTAFAFSTRAAR